MGCGFTSGEQISDSAAVCEITGKKGLFTLSIQLPLHACPPEVGFVIDIWKPYNNMVVANNYTSNYHYA